MTIHNWNTVGMVAAGMLFVFGTFLIWAGEKAIRWKREVEHCGGDPTYRLTPWYVRLYEYMNKRWGGDNNADSPHS